MRRRWALTTFIFLLTAGATACGSGDSSSSAERASDTAPTAPETTPVTPSSTDDLDSSTAGATATTTTAATTTSVPDTTTTSTTSTTTTSTTLAPEPLEILVSNDDGIEAPGIDVLVASLSELDDVEIVVVAPAVNQSGTSDTQTDGTVTSSASATAGGFAGTAVAGTPADSVSVAFDELGLLPDLVVSGVNSGQNIGPFVELSGTVGAARTGARNGVPAIAVSAGLDGQGYETAAALVVDFITGHRADDGSLDLDVSVTSFNVPSCSTGGEMRGLVEVPVAPEFPADTDPFAADCTSTAVDPTDDHAALAIGFASMSTLDF